MVWEVREREGRAESSCQVGTTVRDGQRQDDWRGMNDGRWESWEDGWYK